MSWSVSGVAYIVNTVVKHRACARGINFGRPRASFPREISKPLQRWHMHKCLTAVLHCRKAVCYGSKIFPPETRPAHNVFEISPSNMFPLFRSLGMIHDPDFISLDLLYSYVKFEFTNFSRYIPFLIFCRLSKMQAPEKKP